MSDMDAPVDPPSRMDLLTDVKCGLCRTHQVRAQRRVLGVSPSGNTRVGPPLLMCPSCDLSAGPIPRHR